VSQSFFIFAAMRFFAAVLVFFGVAASSAQTPEVPHKIHFAGMSLSIRDDARREIQKDVDALTQRGRYFDMKVERAKTYFPIIENIFRQEGLPDDFKYLCLQESALVPDAVSVSNAVGFWQFKDFTAQEMGLRVDAEVDERMNIVSASRGAARYLKQNNAYFNNWILALQSYQMGAGGVKRSVGDKFNGASHMEISADTYWYVKKYLAHKIAFENMIQGTPQVRVALVEASERKLSDIAGEVSVAEDVLREYNKWSKRGTVPGDKRYAVLIPTGSALQDFSSLAMNSAKAGKAVASAKPDHPVDARVEINGVRAMRAVGGETVAAIAMRAGLDVSRFLQYNDLAIDDQIVAGQIYFLQKKKRKNKQAVYRTRLGDDLWRVSQQFGVRIKNLKKLNPDLNDGLLAAGTSVRLNAHAMPVSLPVAAATGSESIAELSDDTFGWVAKPSVTAITNAENREGVLQQKTVLKPGDRDSLSQHVIQPGETLFAIAQQYGVTVASLVETNHLNAADPLKSGQIIFFKPKTEVQAPSAVAEDKTDPEMIQYIVKGSDTLYGIARQFGATINELMIWNNKSAMTVTVGEVLWIRKK